MSEDERACAAAWLRAAARPEVDAAIRAIHAEVAEEVARRRPLCLASGNCCRFESFGHRLMVTGLEAAWTVVQEGVPALDAEAIAAARKHGRCPFLDPREGRLCGIRLARPMPCRTFFCDRAADAWQQDLHERCLGELKRLHERWEIPYRYLEWREALSRLAEASRVPAAS